MTPRAALRLNIRAVLDRIGRRLGRDPLPVPLWGPRGTVASLTTPDGAKGPYALDPDTMYLEWRQEVAAGSALRIGFYRPGRFAPRVACPLRPSVGSRAVTPHAMRSIGSAKSPC